MYVNEDVVAIGGHTTGFVPTRTAEYYSGGSWHLLDTYYTHDDGFAVVLKDGNVMVGGGYSGDFGMGQSFGTELYHPGTHSFTHLPILDQKRTHPSALELDGGQVLITGNWYAPDQMELYTPGSGFQKEKEVSQPRSFPYVLRSGQENVLVFSCWDNYGNPLEPILIDRLEGDPFTVPLMEKWRPMVATAGGTRMTAFEVGNYSYLIPVSNDEGALSAMLVSGEEFSLLELELPIPVKSPWGAIQYDDCFFTDKDKGTAWLLGADAQERVYLLELGYGAALRGGKAPVKVYYTQPVAGLIAGVPGNQPPEHPVPAPEGILLPDGRFFLAGGSGGTSYYDPTSVVCLLSPGGAFKAKGLSWWIPLLCALVLVPAAWLGTRVSWGRKKGSAPKENPEMPAEDLMSRLSALMETERFYLKKDLRLSDVAAALGTNVTYISAVVNGTTGKNFPSFLNYYRVRHAQELMRQRPDLPLHAVAEESGFPNETTFLRNFKAQTGLTPSEWKAGR
jgi:AraC-like DNA-binding protein